MQNPKIDALYLKKMALKRILRLDECSSEKAGQQ
jgi:hypothetical protein